MQGIQRGWRGRGSVRVYSPLYRERDPEERGSERGSHVNHRQTQGRTPGMVAASEHSGDSPEGRETEADMV